jgi:K+-transporting ATPase c subunit
MAREQESFSSILSRKSSTANNSKISTALTTSAVTMDTGSGCDANISSDEDLVAACRCAPKRAALYEEEKIKEAIGMSAILSSDGSTTHEHNFLMKTIQ